MTVQPPRLPEHEATYRRLRDLVPDKFTNSEYYSRHYIRTGIRDEVGVAEVWEKATRHLIEEVTLVGTYER